MGIQKQTVTVGPPAPPLAIVLILTPETGQLQIQWPPQVPQPAVLQMFRQAVETMENIIRQQNGGIIIAREPLPPQ
jgi:hypothetical protein